MHGAPAAWRCTDCHQPLCPDCAVDHLAGVTHYESCALCGGPAQPLLRPGVNETFPFMLRHLLELPLTLPSALLGVLLVTTLGKVGHGAGLGLWIAVAWALGLEVLAASAELSIHDERRPFREVLRTRVLASFPLAAVTLGAGWLGARVPLLLPLAAAGVCLLALAVAGCRRWAWPRRDSLLLAGCVLILTVFARGMLVDGLEAAREDLPFYAGLFHALAAAALLLVPRLLGLFIHVHGEALGYPFAGARSVVAFPQARARAQARSLPPSPR